MITQYKSPKAGFRQSRKDATQSRRLSGMYKESKAPFKKIKSQKINLCIFSNTYYFRTLEKESA